MQLMQIKKDFILNKFSIFMVSAVAIIAVALMLRTESLVHAVEGSKPVSASLGEMSSSQGFAEMIDAVSPAVVSLTVIKTRPVQIKPSHGWPFGPGSKNRNFPQWWNWPPQQDDRFNYEGRRQWKAPEVTIAGAGVVFDPSGLIVTNFHVIKNATDIRVTLQDGRVLPAEVVGVDDWTDLAVLRIDAEEQLSYAEFGDTDQVRVGDWAIAIGDPFGLSKTATLGIVSAMGRNLSQNAPKVPLLQVDAAVNSGNSGGPLFNANGQVIGINTMIISPSGASAGVGLAVPSSIVKDVVHSIQNEGRVTRGWLGVSIQNMTSDIADAMGLDEEDQRGSLVSGVEPNSPAENAGVAVGDVIVEFNGNRIEDVRELSKTVKLTKPGSDVFITVLRNGEKLNLRGTVDMLAYGEQANQPAVAQNEETEQPTLGAAVAKLTPEFREKFRIEQSVKGVVITDVASDSPADKAGLREGNIIVSINNTPVNSPIDAVDAIESVVESGKLSALVLVADGSGQQLFVVVDLS